MRWIVGFVVMTAWVSTACGTTGKALDPTEVPSAATPAPPSLVGPTWRLVSVAGHEALPGVEVTAVFGDDNRVAGSAGCNRYFGGAAATGTQIDVGLLGTTMMYCEAAGVMAQEQAYLAALQKAAVYRIATAELHLGPAPGVVTLVFRLQ